jgi:hypothetical protein
VRAVSSIATSTAAEATSTAKAHRRWWPEGVTEPHIAVIESARRFLNGRRRNRLRALEKLYDETVADASVAAMFGFTEKTLQRIPLARSAVDTLHNRIGKDRPRAWFVANNGDWHAKMRAEEQTTWCDGMFEKLEIYRKGAEILKDAMILGTGAGKTASYNGDPCFEQVWIGDLHVDPLEERHRCVRTLYQTIPIDREQLIEMYPDCEEAIRNADPWVDDVQEEDDDCDAEIADLVLCVEAWHLPSGSEVDEKGEKYRTGGRHVVCVSSGTLYDEEWCREAFPFDFLHYRTRPRKFWGLGVVESLAAAHIDANELAEAIGEAYEYAMPGMLAAKGTLNIKRITNEIGRVITYEGVPPQPWVPPPIDLMYLQREAQLEQRSLDGEGISTMSSRGQKPVGLNSGTAIMTQQDVETERFALINRNYEDFYVAVAKNLVCVAEEIVADEEIDSREKLRVLGGRKIVEALTYEDSRLGEGEYVIRCWPVSQLAQTPQGRLEQVDLLRQIGVITDPDDIRSLLDWPDLDRMNSLALSGRELCDKMIANALRGKDFDVHPYMPLDYMMTRATQNRALAELDGAPPDALTDLDALIGLTATLIRRRDAAAAPPPAPMGPANGPPPPALPPDPMGGMPMDPMAPMGPPPLPPEMPPAPPGIAA